ncbi:hypothetical protein [Pseudoxanthomonas kalamensis]|uniref:hypothetical protein n=1 Tax=Pseudoxanthomonas kalamensis TaxID=289483 RepID=UPI001FE46068|nr:hypothetical protein [Pseudoxanthomonas kalamensis]
MTKEHAAIEKSLRQAAELAKATAAEASRVAGIERARADAIEKQLAKFQDLPAALEAAIRRSEIPLKQRKPVSKRRGITSGRKAR